MQDATDKNDTTAKADAKTQGDGVDPKPESSAEAGETKDGTGTADASGPKPGADEAKSGAGGSKGRKGATDADGAKLGANVEKYDYNNAGDYNADSIADVLVRMSEGDRLFAIFEDLYEGAAMPRPGLKVVAATTIFGLSWVYGASERAESTVLFRGPAGRVDLLEDLKALPRRYAGNRFLTVVVSDKAGGDSPFWQRNSDPKGLNAAAVEAGMTLVVIVSPRHLREFRGRASLLKQMQDFRHPLDPSPPEMLRTMIREDHTGALETVLKGVPMEDGSDAFDRIFGAYRRNRWKEIKAELDAVEDTEVDAEWRTTFDRNVVAEETREPAAAAALFLTANFPELRGDLFRFMWEKLFVTTFHQWPAPALPDPNRPNDPAPRQWRRSLDDNSLKDVKIVLRAKADDRRRARFESDNAAAYYAREFAERGSTLEIALFNGLVHLCKPLDHGIELVTPFSGLLARRMRDEAAATPSYVARTLFDVLRLHRQSAEEAYRALQEEYQRFAQNQGDERRIREQNQLVMERESQAAEMSPVFVMSLLQQLEMHRAESGAFEVIEALWQHVMAKSEDMEPAALQYWRNTVVGTMFALDPDGAVDRLHDLFDDDPRPLLGLAHSAFYGIIPTSPQDQQIRTLVRAVAAAEEYAHRADGPAKAWRFSAFMLLLSLWMHACNDIGPGNTMLDDMTDDAMLDIVGRTLLSARERRALGSFDKLMNQLSEGHGLEKDQIAPQLSHWLTTFRLSMLYGIEGRDLDRLAEAIDPAMGKQGYGVIDRWGSGPGALTTFSSWHRGGMQAAGAAVLVMVIHKRGNGPAEAIARTLAAAADPVEAKRFMLADARALRRELRFTSRALSQGETGKKALVDLDETFAALIGELESTEKEDRA